MGNNLCFKPRAPWHFAMVATGNQHECHRPVRWGSVCTLLHPGILCPPPLLTPITPLSWYLRPNQQPISFFPPTTVTPPLETRPGTTLTQQLPSWAFNQQKCICVLIKHLHRTTLSGDIHSNASGTPRMDTLYHIHLCEYHTAVRVSEPGPAGTTNTLGEPLQIRHTSPFHEA